MRRTLAVALLLTCLSGWTQVPAQDTAPRADESANFVVHINVNLVQVDAVVTDSRDRPVTDLRAGDFEIFQDGAQQPITNFTYVMEGVRPTAPTAAPSKPKSTPSPPPPPVHLPPDQTRRVIALVVDDLGLSAASIAQVRRALKKFVDQDLRPGDLVAIVRTGAGVGALQQFTTEKQRLYASVDRLKYNLNGRVSSFAPITAAVVSAPETGPAGLTQQPTGNGTPPSSPPANEATSTIVYDPEEACSLESNSSVGSLAAIRYVVQGLHDLPGRKALVLFSESMQMFERLGVSPARPLRRSPGSSGVEPNAFTCDYSRVREGFRKLTDAAERAGVVIYSVDPRGVDPLMYEASDNPLRNAHNMTATARSNAIGQLARTSEQFQATQQGMEWLAAETGGTFADQNDMARAVRQAADDSANYYLIGYRPPASTFEQKDGRLKFHKIEVKLKRAQLRVRSRSGFFGFPGMERNQTAHSAGQRLALALTSPFAVNDIHLRMTTMYSYWEKSILTTLLYIDTNDLTFTTTPHGTYQAVIDAVGVTFDEEGRAVDNTQKTFTLRGNEQSHALAVKNGIILTLQHVVQRPGPYQMRVAVRDATTNKIGSASQFVQVPNLKRGHLALSGILMKEQDDTSGAAAAMGSGESAALNAKGNEAIRIFKPGKKISWALQILNARDASDKRPNVTVETRIFHDGSEVTRSEPLPVQWPENIPANHLAASGNMLLEQKFVPGEYALQVVVTDNLTKRKYATASQWIDFEVDSP